MCFRAQSQPRVLVSNVELANDGEVTKAFADSKTQIPLDQFHSCSSPKKTQDV